MESGGELAWRMTGRTIKFSALLDGSTVTEASSKNPLARVQQNQSEAQRKSDRRKK